MPTNKVVVHFKNGKTVKGRTSDFFPNKSAFHLNGGNGDVQEIQLSDLKALFFVKDLMGDKDYEYRYDSVVPGAGKRIQVDFMDGETIIGYALGYTPQRAGFFMTPADVQGNNDRIFIVTSATRSVRFLY